MDADYELSIVPGTDIALFQRHRPPSLAARMAQAKHISKFCKENKLSRVIVDLSEEITNARTMELFSFAAKMPGLMRGLKVALVCNPSDEAARFAENVAANRGAVSQAFTTIEEAKAWLQERDSLGSAG